MFKQVLFPVDFTLSSEKVLPFALDVAKKSDAKLHILYVAHDLAEMDTLAIPHPALQTFATEIKVYAEQRMKDFYDEHYEDLKGVERHIAVGDPSDEIIKLAETIGADLIIMGTHGRKGLDRVVFGSVAENVIRNSPIPVMTVNPHKVKTK